MRFRNSTILPKSGIILVFFNTLKSIGFNDLLYADSCSSYRFKLFNIWLFFDFLRVGFLLC